MDIALAIDVLVPAAQYFGSVTDNTLKSFEAIHWHDEREKPTWEEVVQAWNTGLHDPRTSEDKRQEAYQAEADPLHKKAQYYQAEAEGFRLLDDLASAAVAEEKARQYLKDYASKKAEIRLRIPDQPFYFLNATGTYHAEGCSYASESAERLTLAQIGQRGNVKPCTRCNAPALSELENE